MKFAYDNAYYSGRPLKDLNKGDIFFAKEISIINLFEEFHIDAHKKVEGVKKQYNIYISDVLKELTGLKYTSKLQYSKRITIDVVTRLPPALTELLGNLPDIQIELIMRLSELHASLSSINFVKTNYYDIINKREKIPEASYEEIKKVASFYENLIDEIENSDLYKKLSKLSIDELFGAYFYNQGKIELYWPAIAFYSSWKNISITNLTFIVLTHEKAHAITHMGFDLENLFWPTEDFANSDLEVVEGLAQFYTEKVCKNTINIIDLYKDFETLLKDQPKPYTEYKKWLNGEKQIEEKVRLAMINFRRAKKKTSDDFSKFLQSAKEGIEPR